MTKQRKKRKSKAEKEEYRKELQKAFRKWRSIPTNEAYKRAAKQLEKSMGKKGFQEFLKDIDVGWFFFQKKLQDTGVHLCRRCERKTRDKFLSVKAKQKSNTRS